MAVRQPLALPTQPPHRASSTTLKSGLTLNTLGRRRSTSCLQPNLSSDLSSSSFDSQPSSPVQETSSAQQPAPASSMFAVIISRCLHWLHLHQTHARAWSTPTSPRSSTDEPVLPLSASATKTTFGPDVHDEELSKSEGHVPKRQTYGPILLVLLLIPASTAIVLLAMSTLPITLVWPHTVADIAQWGRELHGYSQSGPGPLLHVIGVMTISAVWKHAWSIPGSVIWNVLAGALFPTTCATLVLTLLTAIGSVCATLLATPLAPFLTHLFPKALDMTRLALEGDTELGAKTKSSAWVRLSVLRLVGVVPWSGINIACGVCGVAISDCFLGSFIGSLPWTAVTCQIGDILQTMVSTPSPTSQTISSVLTSPEILFKLIFLSFLSLAPILARERLRGIISNSPIINGSSEDLSRWELWRRNVRGPITHQSRSQKELQVLTEEKIRLQELPS